MSVWLAVGTSVSSRAPSWVLAGFRAWAGRTWGTALSGVASAARHTGVPAVVVAAVALVLAFRIARRALHLVVELALAAALVFAATKAGWLRF